MGKFKLIDGIESAGRFTIVDSKDVSYTEEKTVKQVLDEQESVAEQVETNTAAIAENTSEIESQSGKIEAVESAVADLVVAVDNAEHKIETKASQTEVDQIKSDVTGKANQSEVNQIKNDVAGKANQSEVNQVKNDVAGKASLESVIEVQNDVDVLDARMNEFTRLEEGSTTGDAELADIRISVNGKTYDNAGSAVRGQVTELNETIDFLTKNEIPIRGSVIGTTGKWGLPTYSHVVIPVNGNDKYEMKVGTVQAYYAFLKSYSGVDTDPDYCAGHTGRKTMAAGSYICDHVPVDCKYIYIHYMDSNGTKRMPEAFKINDIDMLSNFRGSIGKINVDLTNTLISTNGIEGIIDQLTRPFIISSAGKWSTSAASDHVLIPVHGPKQITVKAGNNQAICCLLRTDILVPGGVPDFTWLRKTEGEEDDERTVIVYDEDGNPVPDPTRYQITRNTVMTIDVPEECNYIYVTKSAVTGFDIISYMPEYIAFDNFTIWGNKDEAADLWHTAFFDDFDNGLSNWEGIDSDASAFPKYLSRFLTDEETAYTDASCLVLRCFSPEDKSELGSKTYKAPYVSTHSKFAIKRGRISAKIKHSAGIGYGFPFTFFGFGQNDNWPYAPEFDIAELVETTIDTEKQTASGNVYPAGSTKCVFGTNTHFMTDKASGVSSWAEIAYRRVNDAEPTIEFQRDGFDIKDWHIYAVEWDEDYITYKIDDSIARKINIRNLNSVSNFLAPQDIRFNIKATANAVGDGCLYVDWVKAEVFDSLNPIISLSHDDITMHVGETKYCSPVTVPEFPSNCAFKIESSNADVVDVVNATANYARCEHSLKAKQIGSATITMTAIPSGLKSKFTVTVN